MRDWKTYLALSVLLLAPVFWLPRVQAGDLSAHINKGWTTEAIETGRTQGMIVVHRSTNVLFEAMLRGLFDVGGAEFAQRVAVSIAVLVFVWGAFRFTCVTAGNRAWHVLPCIAMFAYGWVFHMGFFDFYLSLGLCFWALSLAWDGSRRGIAMAAPMFALAYFAHALPLLWAAGLGAHRFAARGLGVRGRVYVTAGWLAAMIAVHAVFAEMMVARWSPAQIQMATGADQLWVFDNKYYVVLMGLLVIWGLLFLDLIHKRGARNVVASIPFQFCVISAAAVFILPATVLLPGFQHSLVFIAERMSLGVGICMCALLGSVSPRVFQKYALIALAVVFFAFLYRDERTLNAMEDRMEGTVAYAEMGR